MFPTITHIDDVLPHIEGMTEVRVFTKNDQYTVIDYVIATPELFRSRYEDNIGTDELHARQIRHEVRGLIFCSKTGQIIRRPYHKFFNVGEREETLPENIVFNRPHQVMFKLDGSMIAPFITSDGVLRWGTRAGETDVSTQIYPYLEQHPEVVTFSRYVIAECGATPIFEWMSRDNRVVIDHPEPKLVLTGVRSMNTGEYWPYTALKNSGVDVCDVYDGRFDDINALVNHTRGVVDQEGYVIRFDDSHMYKVKGDWYVAIHKMKEDILYERNVIKLILDGKIDDVKSFLLDTDVERIEKYEDAFWHFMNSKFEMCDEVYQQLVIDRVDRKTWAINHKDRYGAFASIVFKHFDDIPSMSYDEIGVMWVRGVEEVMMRFTISNSKLIEFKKNEGFDYEW